DIVGGILWCYRPDNPPSPRVRAVVARHRGAIIPIAGFDEFMLQLNESLKLPLLDKEIEQMAKHRADSYRNAVQELQASLIRPARDTLAKKMFSDLVLGALTKALDRMPSSDWWTWELKARAETDPERKERVYQEAQTQLPDSPDKAKLIGNFANFMTDVRNKQDEAEDLYRRAIELDPQFANNVGNFANFLRNVRKNYDE